MAHWSPDESDHAGSGSKDHRQLFTFGLDVSTSGKDTGDMAIAIGL